MSQNNILETYRMMQLIKMPPSQENLKIIVFQILRVEQLKYQNSHLDSNGQNRPSGERVSKGSLDEKNHMIDFLKDKLHRDDRLMSDRQEDGQIDIQIDTQTLKCQYMFEIKKVVTF